MKQWSFTLPDTTGAIAWGFSGAFQTLLFPGTTFPTTWIRGAWVYSILELLEYKYIHSGVSNILVNVCNIKQII